MTEPVRYELSDGVATITLNRPDAMNGLDIATKEALLDAVRAAEQDAAVRCVVLTGSGRAFCVGQDLKEHISILQSSDAESLFRTVEEHYNPIVTALATMPKPVVAAVNGVAAGAGASLAFACDFRILTEAAGFNLAFAGVALSCDTGSSWTLPRLVGRAKAIELLYFPRTLGSAESLELGPRHEGDQRRRVRDRGLRPGQPARVRADRLLRRDQALGRVLRRPLVRRVAGVRGVDDDPHREHRGPPQCGLVRSWPRSRPSSPGGEPQRLGARPPAAGRSVRCGWPACG